MRKSTQLNKSQESHNKLQDSMIHASLIESVSKATGGVTRTIYPNQEFTRINSGGQTYKRASQIIKAQA